MTHLAGFFSILVTRNFSTIPEPSQKLLNRGLDTCYSRNMKTLNSDMWTSFFLFFCLMSERSEVFSCTLVFLKSDLIWVFNKCHLPSESFSDYSGTPSPTFLTYFSPWQLFPSGICLHLLFLFFFFFSCFPRMKAPWEWKQELLSALFRAVSSVPTTLSGTSRYSRTIGGLSAENKNFKTAAPFSSSLHPYPT